MSAIPVGGAGPAVQQLNGRFGRCRSGATRVRLCRRRRGAARPTRVPAAAVDALPGRRGGSPGRWRWSGCDGSLLPGIQPKWLICHNSRSSACSSGGLALAARWAGRRGVPGFCRSDCPGDIITAREVHRRAPRLACLEAHMWRLLPRTGLLLLGNARQKWSRRRARLLLWPWRSGSAGVGALGARPVPATKPQ